MFRVIICTVADPENFGKGGCQNLSAQIVYNLKISDVYDQCSRPRSNLFDIFLIGCVARNLRCGAVTAVWGGAPRPQRSKNLYVFGKNNLILGLF